MLTGIDSHPSSCLHTSAQGQVQSESPHLTVHQPAALKGRSV
jgi:hypothetical protein